MPTEDLSNATPFMVDENGNLVRIGFTDSLNPYELNPNEYEVMEEEEE